MRTTLTLEPDVAAAVRHRMAETGEGWKQVVNDLLRAGLSVTGSPSAQVRYETTPHDCGRVLVVGVHNVHEMLVAAEGEAYR